MTPSASQRPKTKSALTQRSTDTRVSGTGRATVLVQSDLDRPTSVAPVASGSTTPDGAQSKPARVADVPETHSRGLTTHPGQIEPQIWPTEAPSRRRRRPWLVVALVALVLMVAGLGVLIYDLAHGHTIASASELPSGAELKPGESLTSSNGQWVVLMLRDGNLAEFPAAAVGGPINPKFESRSGDHPGAYARMQPHGGNLVIYPKGTGPPAGNEPDPLVWAANYNSQPGSYAQLENNGAFVIRPPRSGSGNDSGPGCFIWGTYSGHRCKFLP